MTKKINSFGNIFNNTFFNNKEKPDADSDNNIHSISLSTLSDNATNNDQLGFAVYVNAISNFFLSKDTKSPLTLSIEGEWGAGKSSFLKQLKTSLKEKDSRNSLFVEFNSWEHNNRESIGEAFTLKFIENLNGQSASDETTPSYFKSILKDITVRNSRGDNVKLFLKYFFYILVIMFLIINVRGSFIPVFLVITLKLIWSYIKFRRSGGKLDPAKIKASPAKSDLKRPPYSSEEFDQEYKRINESSIQGKKIFVFIEDLDRCHAAVVTELVETLSMMTSKLTNIIYILEMDRNKVAIEIARRNAHLVPHSDEAANLEYGYEYIEKFIQLSFRLPKLSTADLKAYIEAITNTNEGDDVFNSRTPPNANIETMRTKEPKMPTGNNNQEDKKFEIMIGTDSKKIIASVAMVVTVLNNNPRRIKLFLNLFRLKAYIAYETGLLNESTGDNRLTLEKLGKIVAIDLKWPIFFSDLESQPKLLDELQQIAIDIPDSKYADSTFSEYFESQPASQIQQ